jgi:hypothetical protein
MSCINCKTNEPCELHKSICTCIRMNCWHPYKECDEPPMVRGMVCLTCKTHPEPKHCPTCNQPLPPEKDDNV